MSNHLMSFGAGAAASAVALLLVGVPSRSTSKVPTSPVPPSSFAPSPPAPDHEPEREPARVSVETFAVEPLDPAGELIQPIPADTAEFFEDHLEVDYVPARIELGRILFHDTRLSKDNTLSCASCHDLRYAGVDRAITATGVAGQIGPINTPSVFNAVFNVHQFWDGRAADLEAQADGPPNAPGEMASNWDEISSKLRGDAHLMDLLREAFPDEDLSDEIDPQLWLTAIADFERTLITPNAPFDRYLQGDADAISQEAKEGYQVFKDVGCIECHNGPAIGGKSFQLLGRKKTYFDMHTAGVDLGRFNATGLEEDRHVFKVGNLRNIALTAPYFHDGSQKTLEDAIRTMAEVQLAIQLSDAQIERIEAFLHTLTGEYEGIPLDGYQNTDETRD